MLIYLNGEGGGAASSSAGGGSLDKSTSGQEAVAGWSAGTAAGSSVVGVGEDGAPLRGGETVFYKARQEGFSVVRCSGCMQLSLNVFYTVTIH